MKFLFSSPKQLKKISVPSPFEGKYDKSLGLILKFVQGTTVFQSTLINLKP